MKKIMILAVAAVALAACSRTFETQEVSEPQIGFGSWGSNLTKAEARIQGTSDFLAGDTFAVYGSKTDTDPATPVTTTVFDDVVVTASGSGTLTWDYADHRFWDSSAESYTFYAVSPSAYGISATVNPQTGAIASASTVFAGNNNDVLIAEKKTVLKDDGVDPAETPLTYFNSYGTVELMFHHAASLVDVKVKKSPNLTASAVKISAISLVNINTTGTLNIATGDYANTPFITIASWTSSVPGTYVPANGVTPVYGDTSTSADIAVGNEKVIAEDTAFNAAAPTTPAASTTLFNNLIVVPQTFGASGGAGSQKISLSYTLGTDPTTYTREAYLADFDLVDDADQDDETADTGFQPGKHYILYITIDAHEIMFSADIADWTDVTGYHYIIN